MTVVEVVVSKVDEIGVSASLFKEIWLSLIVHDKKQLADAVTVPVMVSLSPALNLLVVERMLTRGAPTGSTATETVLWSKRELAASDTVTTTLEVVPAELPSLNKESAELFKPPLTTSPQEVLRDGLTFTQDQEYSKLGLFAVVDAIVGAISSS